MLLYGLENLKNAGIREIGVILGPIKEGVKEALGDGSHLGVKIVYIDQPEPKGLAHAILISEDFLQDEPFVTYLGDNLLRQGVQDFTRTFEEGKADCVVGVSPVRDPSRFGIAELQDGRIVRLLEKPKEPKSNLALIGVYVFGTKIFSAAKKIMPSWRNELEITDAIQRLLDDGGRVEVQRVNGWWKDTGKPDDLLEANQLILSDLEGSIKGEVSEDAEVSGRVVLEEGSKLIGASRIRGPATIGRNCVLGPDVYIGPYTSIGDDCHLKNVEIENSIVMKGCTIESGKRIVDSLIGSYSTIANGAKSIPQGHKLIIGERSFAQI